MFWLKDPTLVNIASIFVIVLTFQLSIFGIVASELALAKKPNKEVIDDKLGTSFTDDKSKLVQPLNTPL